MQIYKKFSFIVTFMIFIVFFNMFFGTKPTWYLLLLVLLGMILTNAQKMSNLLVNIFKEEEAV